MSLDLCTRITGAGYTAIQRATQQTRQHGQLIRIKAGCSFRTEGACWIRQLPLIWRWSRSAATRFISSRPYSQLTSHFGNNLQTTPRSSGNHHHLHGKCREPKAAFETIYFLMEMKHVIRCHLIPTLMLCNLHILNLASNSLPLPGTSWQTNKNIKMSLGIPAFLAASMSSYYCRRYFRRTPE